MPTIFIQCPGGENFLVTNITWPTTFNLEGLSSQKSAICFCSSVRFSPIVFTSIIALQKAPFLFTVSQTGGGGGLNCEAESMTIVLISLQCGSTAGPYIGGVGIQRPVTLKRTLYLSAVLVCA